MNDALCVFAEVAVHRSSDLCGHGYRGDGYISATHGRPMAVIDGQESIPNGHGVRE